MSTLDPVVLFGISSLQDARDYRVMLWITRQARYRAQQQRQYGRGKPIKRLHPLARIGMSV